MSSDSEAVPTTEKLAAALEAAACPADMIALARRGFYDDYKSELISPISRLVHDLRVLGKIELAKRAMNGDFDGTRAEADAWAASQEGRETFHQFGVRFPPS